ncbi:hypothetical protein VPH35_022800 [Triticum aestivum]
MEMFTDHHGSSGTFSPRWRDGVAVLDTSPCSRALVEEDLGASNMKQHKRASGLGGQQREAALDGAVSRGQTGTWRLVQPAIDEEAKMEQVRQGEVQGGRAGNLARRWPVLVEEVEAEVGHGASGTWR